MGYNLEFSSSFLRDSMKLLKLRKVKEKDFEKVLGLLRVDPFAAKLRTHRVTNKLMGACWSSRLSPDIRVLGEFNKDDRLVIYLFDIGGHSGKYNVY